MKKSKVSTFDKIRLARTCYDHPAGRFGVLLMQFLVANEFIQITRGDCNLTLQGEEYFSRFGMDVSVLKKGKRKVARLCLDGTEKQFHLAGSLGGALTKVFLEQNWFVRDQTSRALLVTAKGKRELKEKFEISLP